MMDTVSKVEGDTLSEATSEGTNVDFKNGKKYA